MYPIPTPPFVLVDDCPGWCGVDHVAIFCEPGEHERELIAFSDGRVDLSVSPTAGVEVSVSIGGDESVRMPADGAVERLVTMARGLLTAAYRLGVVAAAEAETQGSEVTYSLEFSDDLLPLTPETLRLLEVFSA